MVLFFKQKHLAFKFFSKILPFQLQQVACKFMTKRSKLTVAYKDSTLSAEECFFFIVHPFIKLFKRNKLIVFKINQ